MFKSIYSLDIYGTFRGGLYYHDYGIIDSDFTEEWTGACDQVLYQTTVRAGAIINCYADKNLDVAYNLMLYHKYMYARFDWYDNIEQEIEYNSQHTPGYRHYAKAVRDYLNRMDNLKAFW